MKPHSDEQYRYREQLRRLVQQMDTDVDAFIVEGVSDKKVLRQLGATKRIFTCGGRPHEEFCETVGRCSDRVVILTDFDEAGKELNLTFRKLLEGEVKVLASYRKQFGKLLTSDGRHCIEDLRPLLSSPFDKFIDADLDRLFTPFS